MQCCQTSVAQLAAFHLLEEDLRESIFFLLPPLNITTVYSSLHASAKWQYVSVVDIEDGVK